jgi:hypothetical protein
MASAHLPVPSVQPRRPGLVILGASPGAAAFGHVAWIFAAYFGIA